MSLYARSDLMSVSIPTTSGGCGKTHTRPVTKGVTAKMWQLDCPSCEGYLRGDGKPKLIKNIPPDKERGIPGRMEHVPDSHPHWSTTPEGIPLTPDEQHIYKLRSEQGKQQLEMLQAYAQLSKVEGLNLKDFAEAKWMLDQTIDPLRQKTIKGSVLCPQNHENQAPAKFCAECGISMGGQREIESPQEEELPEGKEPFIDIYKLDFRALQKMCKEKGVNAKGTTDELRQRLAALE